VQCTEFGELQHAWREGLVKPGDLVELGQILSGERARRANDRQITIADLTGLGVQDVQITKAILAAQAAQAAQYQGH
jgi:ornithine cyclodeaminase